MGGKTARNARNHREVGNFRTEFWAKITGKDGASGWHTFQEVYLAASDVWTVVANGDGTDTGDHAIDVTGSANNLTGRVVWMREAIQDTAAGAIRYFFNGGTPAGVCEPYAGDYDAIPGGWYFADGSSKVTTTDVALFAATGYKYGGSDTTFYLPDTREKFWQGALTDEARDNATPRGAKFNDLDHYHYAINRHEIYITPETGKWAFDSDSPTSEPSWNGANNLPVSAMPGGDHFVENRPPYWIGPGIIKT